jgi:hypothetical protein
MLATTADELSGPCLRQLELGRGESTRLVYSGKDVDVMPARVGDG